MADDWTNKLSDYIDGELTEADTKSLEAHLADCEECRETVEQLRAVVSRAGDLQDRAPEKDLWAGIAADIKRTAGEAKVVDITRPARSRWRVSFSVPQLLAASIALMFVSAGSVWMALSVGGEPSVPDVAAAVAEGDAAVLLASFDDPGYDAAVEELERILEAGRDKLDPVTVAVLEQSLATIDQAIAEAREALQTDPTNHYLSEHLSATMNQKVRLLQQAARLATAAS